MEWLTTIATIIAIAVGPFLGIWANEKLEDRKNSTYQRKLEIFKTLMATRATPLARAHVESLNRIDIEFIGDRERKVRDSWVELLDHYGLFPTPPNPPLSNQNSEAQKKYEMDFQDFTSMNNIWSERAKELQSTLLHEMAKLFDYELSLVQIKKAIYYPKLHVDVDREHLLLLTSANSVLLGQRPLYVRAWGDSVNSGRPEAARSQSAPESGPAAPLS